MKSIALVLATLFGCSPETINLRKDFPANSPDMIIVGSATMRITNGSSLAGPPTPVVTNVTYTEPEKGTFTIDPSGIVVGIGSNDTLSLGTLSIDTIRVNKLKICGPGGNVKCTVAAVRIYTTPLPTAPGVSGFVNTLDNYGVPVIADGGTVPLDPSRLIVNSYSIPANDRRLRNNDFTDLSYDLSVDLGNAGVGAYEMNLVIELVVGD